MLHHQCYQNTVLEIRESFSEIKNSPITLLHQSHDSSEKKSTKKDTAFYGGNERGDKMNPIIVVQ